MPRLYRPMKRSDDGLPVVGTQSKELGVRIPPNSSADIDLDEEQHVVLNRRGMSVTSDWRLLMPHLIPKRLKDIVYGASGSNSLSIYRSGEGDFVECAISDSLVLNIKARSRTHANVSPAEDMHIDDYLAALAATRTTWTEELPND